MKSLIKFLRSSIGKKFIVAITGLFLIFFLIGHLVGNLKIFSGKDSFNSYAHFLQSMGPFLWLFRISMIVAFGLHIVTIIFLSIENKMAEGKIGYKYKKTVKATVASRTMIYSGLLVLFFVLFHLAHFTLLKGPGEVFNSDEYSESYKLHGDLVMRKDVYKMVIDGFQNKFVSIFYIVSIFLLCSHLSHGFSSVFQTLGLRTKKSWPYINIGSKFFALILFFGYSSIPFAILLKIVQ